MTIKVYKHSDNGAPVLTGEADSMCALLAACLVNGYGSVNVTSINRSGDTATVVTATPHYLTTGTPALLAGANEVDYNIETPITVIDGTTFTYPVANTPTTPATGTITVKRAGAGFTIPFDDTNKSVFRAATGNRHYLRVDDNAPSGTQKEAMVRCYESMSDIDTGSEPYPTVAQAALGYYWYKSSTTDSTAREWTLITDGETVYLQTLPASAEVFFGCFGDFPSNKAGDIYNTMLAGSTQSYTSNALSSWDTGNQAASATTSFGAGAIAVAREFTGIAGGVFNGVSSYAVTGNTVGSTTVVPYPNPVDNGFYVAPVNLCTSNMSSGNMFRGRMSGMYESLHGRALPNGTILDSVQGLSGKQLMCLYLQNSTSDGAIFIDITGDWD